MLYTMAISERLLSGIRTSSREDGRSDLYYQTNDPVGVGARILA